MIPLEVLEANFQRLCERIQSEMKRLKVPGAAVGVYHEGQEHTLGLGRTSVENPLRVTSETLFQIGSITKTFTGTVLMRLVEEGRLDLDTPLRKILPKFKMADPDVEKRVTTRHLLTHTGGWQGDYFDDFGNGDDALQKMVKRIRKLPQITPLGSCWSYCNTGFNLAGRVIEVLTERPYEQAIRDYLFAPLGMHQSFFYPDDAILTHRFVVGHWKTGKRVTVARPWAIGRAGNPVGGALSTVRDLLIYARFQLGASTETATQPPLRRETLEAMRVEQADAGGRGKMGLTWFIRQAGGLQIYSHGGATRGQQAAFHFIPQKNFAAVLLTNSETGGILTDSFLAWTLETYFDLTLPLPQTLPKSEDELTEYVGRYDLPLSAFDLLPGDGVLIKKDIPRGGFPTPQSPPAPPEPDVRLAFYDTDRVIGLDEPRKGAFGEFLRDENGKVRFLRLGGRLHPKLESILMT
ncbi:MAG: beta-lactamase family protein [Anaerolineales bacterium]|nr:beta-lactamase family protein [Anaerolineales bacterium]MCX7755608.1 beta-lactamase family protein [Anaerolineales bacterium]MDW8276609.1 serine hydrolase domain-containing protein [Anaerolineales bacterium]